MRALILPLSHSFSHTFVFSRVCLFCHSFSSLSFWLSYSSSLSFSLLLILPLSDSSSPYFFSLLLFFSLFLSLSFYSLAFSLSLSLSFFVSPSLLKCERERIPERKCERGHAREAFTRQEKGCQARHSRVDFAASQHDRAADETSD